jgi:U3 small nucleolar RNA-associated protein 18
MSFLILNISIARSSAARSSSSPGIAAGLVWGRAAAGGNRGQAPAVSPTGGRRAGRGPGRCGSRGATSADQRRCLTAVWAGEREVLPNPEAHGPPRASRQPPTPGAKPLRRAPPVASLYHRRALHGGFCLVPRGVRVGRLLGARWRSALGSLPRPATPAPPRMSGSGKKRGRGPGPRVPGVGGVVPPEEARLADLVFGAAGAPSATGAAAPAAAGAPSGSAAPAPAPAAWHDDDDDAVRVDIAGTSRLRKLRVSHDERVITGTELAARLRAQAVSRGGAGAGAGPSWAEVRPRAGRVRPGGVRVAGGGWADDDGSDGDESGPDGDADGGAADEERDGGAAAAAAGLDAALASTAPLTTGGAGLPAGTLSLSRLRDANVVDPCRAVVQAAEFHPGGAVLMTGALDGRLRFFAVDGKRNSRLASVALPDLPIATAAWTGDGTEVIASGRRSFFYVYDVGRGAATRIPRVLGRDEKSLESAVVSPGPPSDATSVVALLGANGTTILVSARSKQWVGNLKMDGTVRAAAFSVGPTGGGGGAGPLPHPELLTVGGGGAVYRWDLRTMRCLGRHEDEGSTGGTAIAAAPDGRSYAVGSAAGVVNIYDAAGAAGAGDAAAAAAAGGGARALLSAGLGPAPRPTKTVLNLTTSIDTLRYSGDGAVLALSSRRRTDALKLLHTASGTVFANWPTDKTPLHYVSTVGFSPGGGYLTIGNDRGRVLLYRLHHYAAA